MNTTPSLSDRLDQLINQDASEESLRALRELLDEAIQAGEMSLTDEIRSEMGVVAYELNPHLDELYETARSTGSYHALLNFQSAMRDAEMRPESYPEGHDELMIQLCPGLPASMHFKSEVIDHLDRWRDVLGLLQIEAHKALRLNDPVAAAYIMALCCESEGAVMKLGSAAGRLTYELGAVVEEYKAEYEPPLG